MAEEPPHDPDAFEPDDPATGEPLTATLAALDEPAPANLLAGIRRRIHRKAFTGQIVELVWTGPALILLQWLVMVLDWFAPAQKRNEGDADE